MINLLPPQEKERLSLEKTKKLAMVLANSFVISTVCLILILFSVKFYILKELIGEKSILSALKEENQVKDILILSDNFKKYNLLLTQIEDFYHKNLYFSDILNNLLEISRPDGLYFTSINIENLKNVKKTKVTI